MAVRFTKQRRLTTQQQQQTSPRKRVRFSLQQDVDIPSPAPLEHATEADLWYSADEMAAFEFEARQLSILVYRNLLQQKIEDTPALALGPNTR